MVEDVPADAELNELELRAAGISYVTRRVDTEAAFRGALGAFAPDIVLSDHSLPQFSAADTLRIALQESPDTPVIIVTGSLDEETAAEYIKAGATDYLLKHHLQRLGPALPRALEPKRAREGPGPPEEARRQSPWRYRIRGQGARDAFPVL